MATYRVSSSSGSSQPAPTTNSDVAKPKRTCGRMNYGNTKPSNAPPVEFDSNTKLSSLLDFRYADAEDVVEISELINHAYSRAYDDSCDESTPQITDKETPLSSSVARTLPLNIANDINSGYNWILLESSPPAEEVMFAACRVFINREDPKCLEAEIDVFGVNQKFWGKGIGGYLLQRAEHIGRSMGASYTKISVGSWQESYIKWAEKRNYIQCGGGLWDDDYREEIPPHVQAVYDRGMSPPPMVFHLRKDLSIVDGGGGGGKINIRPVTTTTTSSGKSLSLTPGLDAMLSDLKLEREQTSEEGSENDKGGGDITESELADLLEDISSGNVTTEVGVAPKADGIEGLLRGISGEQMGLASLITHALDSLPPIPPPVDNSASSGDNSTTKKNVGEKKPSENDDGDDLEGLVGSLLKALKTTDGKAEFERLAKE